MAAISYHTWHLSEDSDRLPAAWEWARLLHPQDRDRLCEEWPMIRAAGQPVAMEARLLGAGGEYRRFLIRVFPERDTLGRIEAWHGTNIDVEDLRRVQDKLQRAERELHDITDAIPHAIVVQLPDGTTTYANQATLDYTGLSIAEVQEPNFRERIFHPDDFARVREERRKALERGKSFEIEQRARRHDGQYRWFLIRYKPVLDQQGRVLRWYATGTDIEDRKQAEEHLRVENLVLREELDRSSPTNEIVGFSEPLRAVLSQVAKVAATDSTVLILGETGTGKELIAQAIHRQSARAQRPFVRVNCAAIPQALIASELFGHEKGAFTGALQRRAGRFEAADGGTLFLDEVGDLPVETQIALLRVLQEREFERVGSTRAIPVDVRLLAATNRDLNQAVADGTFRHDLFYRLNVFPIQMPPLRERKADIPWLVEHFMDRFGKKAGKKVRRIATRTLDLLTAYDWPGNIRELQNIVERAIIVCETDTLSIDESWLHRDPSPKSARSATSLTVLADCEREIIEAALEKTQGRISGPSGAAAILAIPRQTLESKMISLGVDKNQFRARAKSAYQER